MEGLERWGWNETWQGRFAAFAEAGCAQGRISVERKEQERRIHRIYQKQHRKQRRGDDS